MQVPRTRFFALPPSPPLWNATLRFDELKCLQNARVVGWAWLFDASRLGDVLLFM